MHDSARFTLYYLTLLYHAFGDPGKVVVEEMFERVRK